MTVAQNGGGRTRIAFDKHAFGFASSFGGEGAVPQPVYDHEQTGVANGAACPSIAANRFFAQGDGNCSNLKWRGNRWRFSFRPELGQNAGAALGTRVDIKVSSQPLHRTKPAASSTGGRIAVLVDPGGIGNSGPFVEG